MKNSQYYFIVALLIGIDADLHPPGFAKTVCNIISVLAIIISIIERRKED